MWYIQMKCAEGKMSFLLTRNKKISQFHKSVVTYSPMFSIIAVKSNSVRLNADSECRSASLIESFHGGLRHLVNGGKSRG